VAFLNSGVNARVDKVFVFSEVDIPCIVIAELGVNIFLSKAARRHLKGIE
jgi:hypothetical protein